VVGSRMNLVRISSAVAIAAVLSLMVEGPAAVHRVSAGGPDACSAFGDKPGCDGNYSLEASLFADGSASGQYTDRFARRSGIHGVVDCLVVVGNEAWLSGWITSGRSGDFDLAGLPFTTRLRDNGKSARDPADQISTSNVGDPTPCSDMAPFDLLDTPQGQVTVK
jgi:hypothetical protein